MKFLNELAARRRFGMKPGLETIRSLCSALGDPQREFKAIHVAGTNGKGAVCAILDAALRAASGIREEGRGKREKGRGKREEGRGRREEGLRIGRYTSPHLVKINERFFLNGAPVDDMTLERIAEKVSKVLFPLPSSLFPSPTFFEALTAVAFLLYAESKVDYAILECGLGGRLDATNVCDPSLCVITKIGLDHCDWLGDTVERIAAEKAGIIKPGVPVVLGRNEPSVRAVVEARAREVGASFHYAPDLADESEMQSDFPLAGSFNRENAVTALAALKVLRKGNPALFPVPRPRLPSSVCWPGRFQKVGGFIVDGAHNPPAARALRAALEGEGVRPKSLGLICGFCGDKDVDMVLSILAPLAGTGFAVRTNNPRSLSAEETAARMRAVGLDATACPSLRSAIEQSERSDIRTLICGSLFLAGEALVELGAYPWGDARFDLSESIRAS